MRYYKCDGTSCKINEGDRDFGWWLCDIESDEEEECSISSSSGSNSEDASDSEWLIVDKIPTKNPEPNRELIHYNLSSDDISNNQTQKKPIDFNFLSPDEVREKLSNLITSNSFESKLLLSVVDFHKFKDLLEDTTNHREEQNEECYEAIPELEGPSNLILNYSLIVSDVEGLQDSSRLKSLMKELCINSLSSSPDHETLLQTPKECVTNFSELGNFKTPEKLDCLQSDHLKLSVTNSWKEKFLECSRFLTCNLNKLNAEVCSMKRELIRIRIGFQEEDKKTRELLQNSRRLLRELKETNYLNELLLLLMGQAEKLVSKNWPFKARENSGKEVNLII